MFSPYSGTAMVHVASILIYQNTNMLEWLIVSFLLIGYQAFMWVIGVGALLSPETTVEIDEEEYKLISDYPGRMLLQATVLIVAYALYLEGYVFIAGAISMMALSVIMSTIISLYVLYMVGDVEEEEDEDK